MPPASLGLASTDGAGSWIISVLRIGDSNVPMYLAGAPHPNKDRVRVMLAQLVGEGELHRYTAIRRLDAIDAAIASLEALSDEVLIFGVAEV